MPTSATLYSFDGFVLDPVNRQMTKDGEPVDLIGRYFDALVLLVKNPGELVEKERFFEEVWKGMVVSDSALTQCIKEIRKQLGDDVAAPRYVETVPRHGYRFLGTVVCHVDPPPRVFQTDEVTVGLNTGSADRPQAIPLDRVLTQIVSGTLGGAIAGLLGGLVYGSALANGAAGTEMGSASLLWVFLCIGVLLGAVGGAGLSIGMGAAELLRRPRPWYAVLLTALGGLLVGGAAKMLGMDAFHLLLGRAPQEVTGGLEGAALGAFLAFGLLLAGGPTVSRSLRPAMGAGIAGAVAGALIPLLGGHLLGGSLALLSQAFTDSHLHLETLGGVFGEETFGPVTASVLGSLEGFLFGFCWAGGWMLGTIARPRKVSMAKE